MLEDIGDAVEWATLALYLVSQREGGEVRIDPEELVAFRAKKPRVEAFVDRGGNQVVRVLMPETDEEPTS